MSCLGWRLFGRKKQCIPYREGKEESGNAQCTVYKHRCSNLFAFARYCVVPVVAVAKLILPLAHLCFIVAVVSFDLNTSLQKWPILS